MWSSTVTPLTDSQRGYLMIQLAKISTLAVVAITLSACSQSRTSSATGPDLGVVLDRTVMALNYAETEMEKTEDEATAEKQLATFTKIMTGVMNADPRPYTQPIGVNLREDAAFVGYADANNNGVSDAGEKDIFKVEIDGEGNRIIATDMISGEGTYRRSGGGFLAGYFVGRLLSRQSRAGVKPSSFANRNVKSSTDYRKSRPATKTARSSVRSGSSRSGK